MLGATSTRLPGAPTFQEDGVDMEALACMMMVAVLSSRISLRSGVGPWRHPASGPKGCP